MDYITIIIRILLAALFGVLVGYEREHMKKPAGVRTMALITIGAALFTMVSFFFANPDSSARVIANIIVGVGFLGAGSIFRNQDHVSGVTTAATVWVMAGIGIAVGLGMYFLSVLSTLVVFVLLNMDKLGFQKRKFKK